MSLRLGIIGCGAIVDELHLPALQQIDDIETVVLVDANEKQAKQLAGKYSVPKFGTSIDQFANALDAVLIATPPHVKEAVTVQAFELGLHVLAEKPLANYVSECDAMTATAQKANRIFAVGHFYRFWPNRMRIKEAMETEEFGKVEHVFISQGKPYSWNSVSGYTVRREMVPGGVLINAGIHPLDILLWWCGDPVSFNYRDDSIGGLESNCEIEMTFPNGVESLFRMSRTCKLNDIMRIQTDRCTIEVPTYTRDYFYVIESGTKREVRCIEEETSHLFPAIEQFRDFASAVNSGHAPKVNGPEGTRVIQVIEDCYRAKRLRSLPELAPLPGAVW